MRVICCAVGLVIGCGTDDSSLVSTSSSTADASSDSSTSPTETTTFTPTTDPSDPGSSTSIASTTGTGDESGSSSESTGEPMAALCGNGELDSDEGCDDGNDDDDDACDSDCVPTDAIVWSAEYGGAASQYDCAARVVVTDGGTWVAGFVRDVGLQTDGWIGRLDVEGGWSWHSTMVGAGNDDDRTLALTVDVDGNAYAAGWTTEGSQHAWLRRIDSDGAEMWTETWSDGRQAGAQGRALGIVDGALWLAVDRDAAPPLVQPWSFDGVHGLDVMLAAPDSLELSVLDLDVATDATWLVLALHDPLEPSVQPMLARLAPDGSIADSIVVQTQSGATFDDGGISGAVRADGAAVLVSYDAPAGGETPVVRVFDTEGVTTDAWLVELDGEPQVNDVAYGDNGTIVLVGRRHDVPWTRTLASDGTPIWDRLHTPAGANGGLEAVAIAPDGDVVVAGCTGLGSASDIWVRRYRP